MLKGLQDRAKASPSSIRAVGRQLRDGSLTSTDLVKGYLARIAELDPILHAFITVTDELALSQALERDRELHEGRDRGPMHGIPIVHKDIFDTAGARTTIGSGLFADRIPSKNAAVVEALDRAGAIVLGKTNMPEFATDPSGRNATFGDACNPIDSTRSAGGSSGGTAAAVASGLCLGGTGSDTGGSIRIPASWCGIVGLRPTFGLLSLDGAHPRAGSLDAAGPMARTTADCAILLDAMVGAGADYSSQLHVGCDGMTLGVLADWPDTEKDVAEIVSAAVARFAKLGAKIVTIRSPFLSGLDDEGTLDMLLYEFNQILGELYWNTAGREAAFSPVVHANIERGRAITDERYDAILALQRRMQDQVRALFANVDAMLTPTTQTVAPPFDGNERVFSAARQFTLPVSFVGLPALSIPCGRNSMGLPIGLQLIGDLNQESVLLRLGAAYESLAADCQN